MQDRQLYQQILGLNAPWRVQRVELRLEQGEVHLWLEHEANATWNCPECGQACPLHDHVPERTWRHLDTCQYRTVLHAAVPRTRCSEHGVHLVRVPWAEPHGRFTALFEWLVIDWLGQASISAVADRLGLSWDEVQGILRRAVERGLARRRQEPVPRIGIDEKAYRKGHRYLTLVNDLDRNRVLYVAVDRTQASLDGFWPTLTPQQRASIQAVAMDMWDPYERSVRAHVEGADDKIVYDRFHVMRHVTEAVDQVRRRENRALRAEGDDRLVGSRYQWLRNPANFNAHQWYCFRQLRRSNLKTARAWAMKEQIAVLWNYRYEGPARKFFGWWHRWARRSQLPPMAEKASLLKRRLGNILTYLRHGITNALSEAMNAKIQWIKYMARGYRNVGNFVRAIYFHCGGLNLKPSPT